MYVLKGGIRLRGKEVEKYSSSNLEPQGFKGIGRREGNERRKPAFTEKKISERGQGSIR